MKAADIMAAATPGPWRDTDLAAGEVTGDAVPHIIASTYGSVPDARAIVTAVNLFPLYEALREAAGIAQAGLGSMLWLENNLHNADTPLWREMFIAALGDVRRGYDAAAIALDVLQAAEDAL